MRKQLSETLIKYTIKEAMDNNSVAFNVDDLLEAIHGDTDIIENDIRDNLVSACVAYRHTVNVLARASDECEHSYDSYKASCINPQCAMIASPHYMSGRSFDMELKKLNNALHEIHDMYQSLYGNTDFVFHDITLNAIKNMEEEVNKQFNNLLNGRKNTLNCTQKFPESYKMFSLRKKKEYETQVHTVFNKFNNVVNCIIDFITEYSCYLRPFHEKGYSVVGYLDIILTQVNNGIEEAIKCIGRLDGKTALECIDEIKSIYPALTSAKHEYNMMKQDEENENAEV